MIVFHEGLPRAGKSYEAMVKQALPAIKNGRVVVTNIKGLNHKKVATILEMELDAVEKLLIQVPWEKSGDIHEFAVNDCLVIFDEVQDFHPSKFKLSPAQVEFITQHGQRGIDVVLCGQAFKNIHAFWRDRVQRLIYFKKLSALGAEGRYQWVMNERSGPDKFAKVQSGVERYEQKYYGIYKSHVDGVNNKGNLKDERASIFRSKLFTTVIPLFVLLAGAAVYFLWGFFHGSAPLAGNAQTQTQGQGAAVSATAAVTSATGAQQVKPVQGQGVNENTSQQPADYVTSMLTKYRPRLAVLVRNAKQTDGLVEVMDEAYHVREQFRLSGLVYFGYRYELRGDYVVLTRMDGTGGPHVVTAWPIDQWGKAQDNKSGTGQSVPPPVRMDASQSASSHVYALEDHTRYPKRELSIKSGF
ncbi:zonular occludens toxin family protein [Chromobacterium sp. ASV23]|uniref:zonular occludens toxin family protein n=1 Tax=Chromobacterium sp. ASV23 TaxID=2795110 RepID=UPI0018EC31B7|nr:zonular occludens toxin domain-containing protein [Chromobacterium sp. ASV23]